MSWWVVNGVNYLGGIVGDAENPAVICDEWIIAMLHRYPESREDFNAVVPTMLAEEQDRLTTLIEKNPSVNLTLVDARVVSDYVQSKHNRAGVRTQIPKPRN